MFITILVLILLTFIFGLKEGFFDIKKDISICVVIPCFPRDTHKLIRLINSINKQTVLPDKIIIGHSEMNKEQALELENKLNISKVNLKVINTEEKKYAGGNRNMAALHNNCDYITFIDADDIMIENKIEILKKYIKIYKPLSIIHNFTEDKNYKYNNEVKKVVLGKDIFDILDKRKDPIYIYEFQVHHGHITIHKDVIKNVKQKEDNKWKRGQDSKFVRDINTYYGRKKNTMIYLDIPLSFYIEASKQ